MPGKRTPGYLHLLLMLLLISVGLNSPASAQENMVTVGAGAAIITGGNQINVPGGTLLEVQLRVAANFPKAP